MSVDECGCTTESSVALLMRMEPRNLILVGMLYADVCMLTYADEC